MQGDKLNCLFFTPGLMYSAQQAALALFEINLLDAFVTTFAYRPNGWMSTLLKQVAPHIDRELLRREVTGIPANLVITHPVPELARILARRMRVDPIWEDWIWERAELWFDRKVAQADLKDHEMVYGFEHACLETFQRQKSRGGKCIYHMPICHHKVLSRYLDAELGKFPEVVTPYDEHLRRNAPRRNARKDEELELADLVVAPSQFVKESVIEAGVPAERIALVRYAAPPVIPEPVRRPLRPVVFLSAGSQSIRKGTHYLLEAWRKLNPGSAAELWLVGRMSLPPRLLEDLPGRVVIKPPVPRAELYSFYRRASVLVLPSLAEGFALVITEAMAHGLPVITTPNSGAEGFIEHGKNGFILPIGNATALQETMEWCIHNPEAVAEIGARARESAAGWQWKDFRRAHNRAILQFLDSSS